MDAEGMMIDTEGDEEESDDSTPDELVGQFREFLEQVRPEDFSG
jgi:hypothetical protein